MRLKFSTTTSTFPIFCLRNAARKADIVKSMMAVTAQTK